MWVFYQTKLIFGTRINKINLSKVNCEWLLSSTVCEKTKLTVMDIERAIWSSFWKG